MLWTEPDAIEALLDRYLGKMYGLAISILRNRHEAEEAVREAFLTVVRNADLFHGNPAFPSWIYRICVDACLTRLRMSRKTRTVPVEEFLPVFTEEDTHARPVGDWSRKWGRRIPEEEIERMIGKFTEELPEIYRMVFALCDVHRFSCEETAQVLGVSIEAVKSRRHRARLCLRERLDRCFRDRRAV